MSVKQLGQPPTSLPGSEAIREQLLLRYAQRALDKYNHCRSKWSPKPDCIWVHLSAWGLPFILPHREVAGIKILTVDHPLHINLGISVAGNYENSYTTVRLGPPNEWEILMDVCDIIEESGD